MNFRERKESRAFTIVELLVVIVVIGILAAITIVSYSGISSKAIAVSLTSDLDSDAKLLQLYRVDNGVFPTTLDTEYCPKTPTVDNRYCLKASSGNTLTYSGGGQSFELTNTHSATGQSYKITEDGTIAEVVSSGASSSVSFLNSWGGVSGDWGNAIVQDDDGDYVIVGSYQGDGLVSKYSSDGLMLWSKDISGNGSEEIHSITKTSDGGYLVAGHTSGTDFLIIKFSSEGSLLWKKIWGGPGIDDSDILNSIISTSDGNFVVAGEASDDSYIAKLSTDGSVLWNKTWGGTGSDIANSVTQLSDGSYVVVGETMSFGSGVPPVGVFIAKYDSDGVFVWNKVLGGDGFDVAEDVKATSNGGFVMTGYTENYGFGGRDAFISAYDSSGVNTLSVAYGNTDDDEANSIIQTADGGYIIAGSTYQYRYGQTTSNDEPFLAKISATGTLQWSKIMLAESSNWFKSVIQTADGGLAAVGGTSGYIVNNRNAVLTAKLKPTDLNNNCLAPMCYDSFANIMDVAISEIVPTATKSIYVSINPADTIAIGDLNIATSPISIPENQHPSSTIVFSGREMYIEYPGLSQSVCKQWTVPTGKKIYGFYVNYAVEKDYDYFVVSVDSVERLNVTGPNLGGEYIDISSTPGDVLSACVNADDAVQEGFGAQIKGVYYK